jgi:hypothetical protein
MIRFIAALIVAASLGGVAQAQIAGDPAREKAFLAQIELAKAAPGYKETRWGLDVYRALVASGLPVTTLQRATAGECAMNRGIAIEAEMLLKPLVDTGEFGGDKDQKKLRNAAFFRQVQAYAEKDRYGRLEEEAADAKSRPTGTMYVVLGESFAARGDHARAVQLIAAGLSKGALDPIETSYAALELGVAQFRAGQFDQARETWNGIGGDGGAKELAQAWLMIAQG